MDYTKLPRCRSSGPKTAKIVSVGEAPGEQEEITGLPFMGTAGQELTRMLLEAGMQRKDVYLTNVLSQRPPNNKLPFFCGDRAAVGKDYLLPPLSTGKYLLPEFLPELDRLRDEINEVNPNLVVALGATATWALMHQPKIGVVRGVVAPGVLTSHKVLPTYHPSGVLRNWAWRVTVIADLLKAERESKFPEILRPERTVYFDPTFEDVIHWMKELNHAPRTALDIETKRNQITCIGFAASVREAFVVPFWDLRQTSGSYWPDLRMEREVWNLIETHTSSVVIKTTQNGLYDIQYLLRAGLKLNNFADDTMILHHAKYPELQKSLGYMGSIYTNEASWKLMRPRNEDVLKREDA